MTPFQQELLTAILNYRDACIKESENSDESYKKLEVLIKRCVDKEGEANAL